MTHSAHTPPLALAWSLANRRRLADETSPVSPAAVLQALCKSAAEHRVCGDHVNAIANHGNRSFHPRSSSATRADGAGSGKECPAARQVLTSPNQPTANSQMAKGELANAKGCAATADIPQIPNDHTSQGSPRALVCRARTAFHLLPLECHAVSGAKNGSGAR